MYSSEAQSLLSDLQERIASSGRRKEYRCEYKYHGRGKHLFDELTAGWDTGTEQAHRQLAGVPGPRWRGATKRLYRGADCGSSKKKQKTEFDDIDKTGTERKSKKESAVTFISEGHIKRLLPCEEADRNCSEFGYCDDTGIWWVPYRLCATLVSKPLVADKAWKEHITFHCSFLQLKENDDGEVDFKLPAFSASAAHGIELAEYNARSKRIHLAALEVARSAPSYITDWQKPVKPSLARVYTECPCSLCQPGG